MKSKIAKNLLLVDDYGVVIEGLKALLDNTDKYNILEVAYSGEEAVSKVNAKVDLIIMDVNLPGINGIEATRRIKNKYPKTKILAMSRHTEPNIIKAMLDAGASGYITKEFHDSPLEEGIDKVLAGGSYLCNKAQEIMANYVMNMQNNQNSNLSDRELEILNLLVSGRSNDQIAEELFISKRTVETHRKNIMSKTGEHNLGGIVRYAYNHGLANPELD